MKKGLFFVAAMLGMVACSNEYVETQDVNSKGQPISFRVAVDNVTRASDQLAYEGTDAEEIQIAAVGSFYQADGTVLAPTVFGDPDAPEYRWFGKNSGVWKFYDGTDYSSNPIDLYLPLGNDVRMDVLAFAAYPYLDSYMKNFQNLPSPTSSTPSGSGNWEPYFSYEDNFAKAVRFFQVDTYEHPFDIMYASCNGISSANPHGVLHFKHATANVVFNVKFHYEGTVNSEPAFYNILFIDPTANNYELRDFIYGYTSPLSSYSTPSIDVVTLNTIGDLTIDNSKNKLEAKWSNLDKDIDKAKLQGDHRSATNTQSITDVIEPVEPGSGSISATEDEWYQLGSELLVPVQPKPNFSIYYKMNGKYYLYEVNAPRGIWEMGKKYIYNITINWTAVDFDCDVVEWVLGGEHNLNII